MATTLKNWVYELLGWNPLKWKKSGDKYTTESFPGYIVFVRKYQDSLPLQYYVMNRNDPNCKYGMFEKDDIPYVGYFGRESVLLDEKQQKELKTVFDYFKKDVSAYTVPEFEEDLVEYFRFTENILLEDLKESPFSREKVELFNRFLQNATTQILRRSYHVSIIDPFEELDNKSYVNKISDAIKRKVLGESDKKKGLPFESIDEQLAGAARGEFGDYTEKQKFVRAFLSPDQLDEAILGDTDLLKSSNQGRCTSIDDSLSEQNKLIEKSVDMIEKMYEAQVEKQKVVKDLKKHITRQRELLKQV